MKTSLLTPPSKSIWILAAHLIALFASQICFAQTITRDDNNNSGTDFVCPVQTMGYTLNVTNTVYTNCTIKWTATGGDIIGADNLRQVSVQWQDVPNTKAQLKCTLSGCTDSKGNPISGTDAAFTDQLILSVKDQSISTYSNSPINVDFCTKSTVHLQIPHVYVQGTGGLGEPPQQEVAYGWQLPELLAENSLLKFYSFKNFRQQRRVA